MHNAPTHLTFCLADLTIAVPAAQAYLVLDRRLTLPLEQDATGKAGVSVLYRGEVIPCLDLSRSLGLEVDAEVKHPRSLILEHAGRLACLYLPKIRVVTPDTTSSVRVVSDRFQGLARLLIAEQLRTPSEVWHVLDVEMAVRIASQPVSRPMQVQASH